MPAIARLGDPCGGAIVASATKMTVNGLPVALGPAVIAGEPVAGDPIDGHGDSPHSNAELVQGSSKLTCEGRPVCVVGHAASCGHTITVGSGNARAPL